AGNLADAGRSAGREDDNLTPACEGISRAGHERGGQVLERLPVRQRQRARVVQLILGTLVFTLPADDVSRIALDDAVPHRLIHHPDQRGEAVLDRGPAAFLSDPPMHGTVHNTIAEHPYWQVAERWHHSFAPPREV